MPSYRSTSSPSSPYSPSSSSSSFSFKRTIDVDCVDRASSSESDPRASPPPSLTVAVNAADDDLPPTRARSRRIARDNTRISIRTCAATAPSSTRTRFTATATIRPDARARVTTLARPRPSTSSRATEVSHDVSHDGDDAREVIIGRFLGSPVAFARASARRRRRLDPSRSIQPSASAETLSRSSISGTSTRRPFARFARATPTTANEGLFCARRESRRALASLDDAARARSRISVIASSRRTLFRRAVKKRQRTGRAVSVRVGRSPTSPVTTPHPRPSSIDRRADAIARSRRHRFVPSRRRFVALAADSCSRPHGRSRGASRGRSMESTSREPSRGGGTRWQTRIVIGCACVKSSLACIDMWANSARSRSRVHRGRPVRISSLGTPTRARRCPDEEKERLGRRP